MTDFSLSQGVSILAINEFGFCGLVALMLSAPRPRRI
jgi:hypothetical protein